MLLFGAMIGTAFGVTVMSILSANAYGRGYDKGFKKGKKVNIL